MKVKLFLWSFVSSLVFLTGCMSDISEESLSPDNDKKVPFTIGVDVANDDTRVYTRVAYTESDEVGHENGPELSWEAGDQLAIIGYDSSTGYPKGKEVLSLTKFITNSNAIFRGWTVVGADSYKVYYPVNAISNVGWPILKYNNQVQNGNGSTNHLKKHIFLKYAGGDMLTTEEILLEVRDIPMIMQNCIMRFKLKNLPLKQPTMLEWRVNGNVALKLALSGITLTEGGELEAYACFNAFPVKRNDNIKIVVEGTDKMGAKKTCVYESKSRKGELIFNPNTRYVSKISTWK